MIIQRKNKITKLKVAIIPIVLALFIVSCAYNVSLVKTSYDILAVSQTSYDTSMKVVADLYKRNIIDEVDKAKILSAAEIYYQAHNAAVDALVNYENSKSAEDQELLVLQISIASKAMSTLLSILSPYLGGK